MPCVSSCWGRRHTPAVCNESRERHTSHGFWTFRQKHGGGRFGKKNMPKRLRLKAFAETFRMICGVYPVYARSPSPSQRPAHTMIASRSPFPRVGGNRSKERDRKCPQVDIPNFLNGIETTRIEIFIT